MSKYILSCCSTADLSKEHFDKIDVHYICFHYRLDGKEYPDDLGQSIPFPEFYRRMAAGAPTATSQVNVQEYIDYFEGFLKKGFDILHVCLSSGISGTYNSACAARDLLREEYTDRKIYILDSLGASSGYGLLMDELAQKKAAGMDIDSLYSLAEQLDSPDEIQQITSRRERGRTVFEYPLKNGDFSILYVIMNQGLYRNALFIQGFLAVISVSLILFGLLLLQRTRRSIVEPIRTLSEHLEEYNRSNEAIGEQDVLELKEAGSVMRELMKQVEELKVQAYEEKINRFMGGAIHLNQPFAGADCKKRRGTLHRQDGGYTISPRRRAETCRGCA